MAKKITTGGPPEGPGKEPREPIVDVGEGPRSNRRYALSLLRLSPVALLSVALFFVIWNPVFYPLVLFLCVLALLGWGLLAKAGADHAQTVVRPVVGRAGLALAGLTVVPLIALALLWLGLLLIVGIASALRAAGLS